MGNTFRASIAANKVSLDPAIDFPVVVRYGKTQKNQAISLSASVSLLCFLRVLSLYYLLSVSSTNSTESTCRILLCVI